MLNIKFGSKTRIEFLQEERLREEYLIKQGFKILRISSEKDYLPSDKELVKLINNAIQDFKGGKDVVEVSIDELFNRESLRKIIEKDFMEDENGSS